MEMIEINEIEDLPKSFTLCSTMDINDFQLKQKITQIRWESFYVFERKLKNANKGQISSLLTKSS